jgi:hypothetical protein
MASAQQGSNPGVGFFPIYVGRKMFISASSKRFYRMIVGRLAAKNKQRRCGGLDQLAAEREAGTIR